MALLKGTITRFNVNHVDCYVTFTLANDETIYLLDYFRFFRRSAMLALSLTEPGDVVSMTYSPDEGSEHPPAKGTALEGKLEMWENETVGLTATAPKDLH